MAIPDFQTIMLPLLRFAADGQDKVVSDAMRVLAEEFNLTVEDRNELLPSRRSRTFDKRVGWAKTYLQKARLLESTGHARFRITQRGSQVLQNSPAHINTKFLDQFPEFHAFKSNGHEKGEPSLQELSTVQQQTPQELLEASYQLLRQNLAQEMLEKLKVCSPKFFEQLIVDVLIAMGYGGSHKDAGKAVGQTGDGGIDGVIKEDKLGLDTIYLQAKRWEGTVGAPTVQAFAGALMGKQAHKGVLITTSQFSQQALSYAKNIGNLKIILIDGEQLVQFMIDHDVGVTEETRYILKRIDLDYFEEE